MIRIVCVGKIKENYLAEMIRDYLLRINKYHRTEIVEVKDSNPETEASLIIKQIPKQAFKVIMDIDGVNLNSEQLSVALEEWLCHSGNVCFIIGGSNGLSDEVKSLANYRLSFGKNTFPHGLFRGILLEQLYRSFKILNNETYHK